MFVACPFALRVSLGIMLSSIHAMDHNGQSVFIAQSVTRPADKTIAFQIEDILLMLGKIHGTENQVVMNMAFVNMGSQHIFIFTAKNAVGKLPPDLMGSLRRNLARFKCLYQLMARLLPLFIARSRVFSNSTSVVSTA